MSSYFKELGTGKGHGFTTEEGEDQIIEEYLQKYSDKKVLEIGVSSPEDKKGSLLRWIKKLKINPNTIGVDLEGGYWDLSKQIFFHELLLASDNPDYAKSSEPYQYLKLCFNIDSDSEMKELLEGPLNDPMALEFRNMTLLNFGINHSDWFEKKPLEYNLRIGDAKNLEKVVDKESIDLALAFSLFGKIDVSDIVRETLNPSRDILGTYQESRRNRLEEIADTYDQRIYSVVKGLYNSLKPGGVALISNRNIIQFDEGKIYDREYLESKFKENGFSGVEIFQGSKRYLMVCRK
jgi:hypothetical protein